MQVFSCPGHQIFFLIKLELVFKIVDTTQTVDHKIENCPCKKKVVGSDPGALKGFFSQSLNQRVLVEFLHLTNLSIFAKDLTKR